MLGPAYQVLNDFIEGDGAMYHLRLHSIKAILADASSIVTTLHQALPKRAPAMRGPSPVLGTVDSDLPAPESSPVLSKGATITFGQVKHRGKAVVSGGERGGSRAPLASSGIAKYTVTAEAYADARGVFIGSRHARVCQHGGQPPEDRETYPDCLPTPALDHSAVGFLLARCCRYRLLVSPVGFTEIRRGCSMPC